MPKPPAGGLTGAVPAGGRTATGGAAKRAGERKLARRSSRQCHRAPIRLLGRGRRAALAWGEGSGGGVDWGVVGEFMRLDMGWFSFGVLGGGCW